MSPMPRFSYHQPTTVDEALALLTQYGAAAKLIAGGTEVLPKLRSGALAPEQLISTRRIVGLEALDFDPASGLRIGGGARLSDVAACPEVQLHYPALASACQQMCTTQIRNMATVSGNLVNGSPCADTAPPLLVYGASVHLVRQGPDGSKLTERRVDLEAMFQGPGQVCVEPEELLLAIEVPPPAGRCASAYVRHSARSRVDLVSSSAAAWLSLDASGHVAQARIALGSVAPTPLRCPDGEAVLVGKQPDHALLVQAAQQAAAMAKPISDVRASQAYRRAVLPVLTRRALEACVARLQAGGSQQQGASQ